MSKTKKLKLTKITLETKDGKIVELNIDEAKELHDQLHPLFYEKHTYIPSTPIVIECNLGQDIQCFNSDNGLSVLYYGNTL